MKREEVLETIAANETLEGLDLSHAFFGEFDVSEAVFSQATLLNSIFTNAKCIAANFTNAKCPYANFTGANLYGAKIHRIMEDHTNWDRANKLLIQ